MNVVEKEPKVKKDLVFIIEDNEMYSMMIEYNLSLSDCYRFIRLNSGEECIANLHQNPDAIILDYYLPGIDGVTTLKKIKAKLPDVPVVALSRNRDDQTVLKLMAEGVDKYIYKKKDSIEKLKTSLQEMIGFSRLKKLRRKKIHGRTVAMTIIVVIASLFVIYKILTNVQQ
jgi:CheY-like chemotaxis protein